MITLFEQSNHKNLFFNDLTSGEMVQANQHLIIDNEQIMVLDPGGHKVYPKFISEIGKIASVAKVAALFFSHQDPDIVAATNGWLMVTDAKAYIPGLWTRFIPHFGVDDYLIDRLIPLPDKGMELQLGDTTLKILPAHFLHSPGNYSVYDPYSRILYSGDIGASLGSPEVVVTNFDEHIKYMEPFHKRYMASKKAIGAWLNIVSKLEIEVIAPQHGSIMKGKDMAGKFFDWFSKLECGVDLITEQYNF